MASNENAADQEIVGNQFDPDAKREAEKKLKDLKKANLRSVFGGGMGRLSLVLVGLVFLGIFVIGAYKIFGKKGPVAAPVPANNAMIDAPGSQGADSYAANDMEAQMRRQRNQQQAEEARASGSAYIAPPVLKAEPAPEIKTEPAKGPDAPRGTPEEQRRQLQAQAQQQAGASVPDPSAAAAQQRRDAQMAEIKQLRDNLKKDEIMPQIMVASGLGWKGEAVKPFSTSNYSLPDRTKAQQTAVASPVAGSTTTTTLPTVAKTPLFTAGEACYGTLDYGINTDNPGNVAIATIPLCKGQKNVKVIGKYEFKDQAQAVSVSFDKMAIPGKQTMPIQAIAIDEKTWGTGIADEVDNHTLRRFGMTAIASFMSGMGKAAQVAVGTTTTTTNGLASQTTTVQEPMSASRQLKIALGEMGQQAGDQLKRQNENIKPTVKVYGSKESDRGIGIVFLADVYEEKK